MLPALVRVFEIGEAEAEFDSRDAAAAMRAYADEIDARAARIEDPDAQAAPSSAGPATWPGTLPSPTGARILTT